MRLILGELFKDAGNLELEKYGVRGVIGFPTLMTLVLFSVVIDCFSIITYPMHYALEICRVNI